MFWPGQASFFTGPDIAYKKCGSLNGENCTLAQDMWAAVHVHKVVSTHSIAQYVCHWISYRLLQSVTAECRLNRGVRHKKERHLWFWNAKWTETTATFLLASCMSKVVVIQCITRHLMKNMNYIVDISTERSAKNCSPIGVDDSPDYFVLYGWTVDRLKNERAEFFRQKAPWWDVRSSTLQYFGVEKR